MAGKTGTTNDQHDAWFIGYTPDLLAGVWVGYDDHRPLGRDATGGRVAAPIWVDFMKDAIRDKPATAFAMPEGIRCVLIDRATGLRAREDDWDAPLECFKDGTEPQAFAPIWQPEPASGTEAVVPEGGPVPTDPLTGFAMPTDSPLSPTPASAAPIPPAGLGSEGSPGPEGASAPVDDEATPPQPIFQ